MQAVRDQATHYNHFGHSGLDPGKPKPPLPSVNSNRVLTRANRLPASQFSRSCGGIHPARSRTSDQRGLLLAQRRRLHRSTTAEAPAVCCTGEASPLAVRLLRMRVATTRLARVIARLRVLRAIVRIRAPPARIEICRRMHLRPQIRNQMPARTVTARTNTDDQNHAALRWASSDTTLSSRSS